MYLKVLFFVLALHVMYANCETIPLSRVSNHYYISVSFLETPHNGDEFYFHLIVDTGSPSIVVPWDFVRPGFPWPVTLKGYIDWNKEVRGQISSHPQPSHTAPHIGSSSQQQPHSVLPKSAKSSHPGKLSVGPIVPFEKLSWKTTLHYAAGDMNVNLWKGLLQVYTSNDKGTKQTSYPQVFWAVTSAKPTKANGIITPYIFGLNRDAFDFRVIPVESGPAIRSSISNFFRSFALSLSRANGPDMHLSPAMFTDTEIDRFCGNKEEWLSFGVHGESQWQVESTLLFDNEAVEGQFVTFFDSGSTGLRISTSMARLLYNSLRTFAITQLMLPKSCCGIPNEDFFVASNLVPDINKFPTLTFGFANEHSQINIVLPPSQYLYEFIFPESMQPTIRTKFGGISIMRGKVLATSLGADFIGLWNCAIFGYDASTVAFSELKSSTFTSNTMQLQVSVQMIN